MTTEAGIVSITPVIKTGNLHPKVVLPSKPESSFIKPGVSPSHDHLHIALVQDARHLHRPLLVEEGSLL